MTRPADLHPLALPTNDESWGSWLAGLVGSGFERVAALRAELADPGSGIDVLARWNELDAALRNIAAPTNLLSEVHPDPEVRKAAEDAAAELSRVRTEIGQDRRLYERLMGVPTEGLSASWRHLLTDSLRDFRRAGVDADEATRRELRKLTERAVELSQAFDRAIRDDVRAIMVPPEALEGMPEDWIAAHPADAEGLVRVTTDYPDAIPFMAYATDRDARIQLSLASQTRAWPQNDAVLRELIEVRNTMGRLLGHPDWADFDAAVKMVGSGSAIEAFIEHITDAAQAPGQRDLEMLRERTRRDHPEIEEITQVDGTYYTRVLKQELFDVDAQQVRRYFPFAAVRQGLLNITSTLFGIDWTPRPDAPVWHPDVIVFDAALDGEPLGRVYLDLHPREGKFKHAAQFDLVAGIAGRQLPEGSLVCNLPEGLLEHQQVVTLFHEFGHLIHHLVGGRVEQARFSGVATEWDFVEAPSQMLEEWAWDAEVLATFARDEQGTPIPADLVGRMRAARDLGKGWSALTQMSYAAVSYFLHHAPWENLDAQQLELRRRYSPVAPLDHSHFHASFGHLSGYTSGYYTYMWSLVIAKDLFSAFDPNNLCDPRIAHRYRDKVLAPGGTRDAADLVADFLGRPYDSQAFADWLAS